MRSDEGERVAPGVQNQAASAPTAGDAAASVDSFLIRPPSLSLPKGGGAIRGLGEKFAANPVTGTGSMTVPIATSPGRSGFGPQLSLTYDSAAGNGPFGLGWSLSLPSISRKTDKGLPRYTLESDVFILSGVEDLVPTLVERNGTWAEETVPPRTVGAKTYGIRRYRPRIEGLFALIERWTNVDEPDDCFWRSISRDNVTTWYGRDEESRIFDPADYSRVFAWLICESHDDKGNVISYRYKPEDDAVIDVAQAHERNRSLATRGTQRYLKHIFYGNRVPYFPQLAAGRPWPTPPDDEWFFEVVFDYGEHDAPAPTPTGEVRAWPIRNDPFSTYRSGFEVRTYRLCQRVLMFHRFAAAPAIPAVTGFATSCLVRSTNFTYSHEQDPRNARNPIFSCLLSVTQTGYKRRAPGYSARSLPPVEFEYTQPVVDETVRDVDGESLENLPIGLDGIGYQWVDLDGEGLSGVLTEQAGAWFYKRNLGPINIVREQQAPNVKRALAKLAPIALVREKPNALLSGGGAQLTDLSGDGRLDVVMLDGTMAGVYERDEAGGWNDFRPFPSRLNRKTADPNLRFVDLDGDGHVDVLITEDDALTWHQSLDIDGFGPAQRVFKEPDQERGPALVFADGTQSIYLADMSGDGLTDLVRIRNREVCYWPNLGYGRFGAKVTMDRAPWFDAVDRFDERRILLADIDGSGVTDIVYLHADGPRLYFNQSGNSWSAPRVLESFPRADSLSGVTAVDLLGNGTACLVWSSSLPGSAGRQVRYVDLMSGQKPHLLVRTRNNLGGETEVEYAPSTKFYLLDERAGTPWVTRLPFPVHVVERVTVRDTWRGTTFSTTSSYHHGYFDGFEREFRGFGRVEQTDVEDHGTFSAGNASSPYITNQKELYQPPIKTVTWFHTGAFLERERILSHFQHEYFPRSFGGVAPRQGYAPAAFPEKDLTHSDLDVEDLSAAEWREALRACKGMPLRQEIYELDVDALTSGQQQPVKLFAVAQHSCHIQRVQPTGDNRHAVFLVTESEAITYHHELDLTTNQVPDPRVAHTLNLRVDPYGHVLQSVAVVYPRRRMMVPAGLDDSAALIARVQAEPHLAYTEARYTDDNFTRNSGVPDVYRIPLPCEVSTYELRGIRETDATVPPGPRDIEYVSVDELREYRLSERHQPAAHGLVHVPFIHYHQVPDGTLGKRIVERLRTTYFDDASATSAPTNARPFGKHGPRGLKYQDYKLALTKALLDDVFRRPGAGGTAVDLLGIASDPGGTPVRQLLDDPGVSGYVSGATIDTTAVPGEPPPDEQYWMASGVPGFRPNVPPRFFLPARYTDSFGNEARIAFDARDLFVQSTTDTLGNQVRMTGFDYRVLAPREMIDASGNYAALAFDLLGMPVASAIMGKNRTESGDSVAAIDPDPPVREIERFFRRPFARARPLAWLGNATARYVYDLGERTNTSGAVVGWGQRPAGAVHILREQHVSRLGSAEPDIQIAVLYSDGAGAAIVKKAQAEPDPDRTATRPPLRWIASGKTVFNNKGKPVKQYEPYFSITDHRFDPTEVTREVGVTPVMYYDGPGRLVRTELPDGSFSRVAFSPWHVESFDPNDTVLDSDWYRARAPVNPAGAAPAAPKRRAAWLAARCSDTPVVTVVDSLGREVIAVAHNRVEDPAGSLTFDGRRWKDERYVTFTKLDVEGKPLWIRDALGHLVMQYVTAPKPAAATDNRVPIDSVPGYDIAGNLLFQHSMDAGGRWMLIDAAGKPMLAWDFNEVASTPGAPLERRLYFTAYDELHRPTALWLRRDDDPRVLLERFEYQDGQPNDSNNLNGQAVRHYEQSGLVETLKRDFKGNVENARRTLTAAGRASVVDWRTLRNPNGSQKLTSEPFTQISEYDALSRVSLQYNWHRAASRVAAYRPKYNAGGVLTSENLLIGTARTPNGPTGGVNAGGPDAIREIRYNVRGQKELLRLGNGTTTTYEYDPFTFRLTRILTRRHRPAGDACSSAFNNASVIQDLQYTYDPVGNITQIVDAAQATRYGANQRIEPSNRYEYDALYRLTSADGKESAAPSGAPTNIELKAPEVPCPAPDPATLRNYTQHYTYDPVGNITRMRHLAGAVESWTRDYSYAYEVTSRPPSNRLATTTDGAGIVTTYRHDTHGNMLNLANAPRQFDLQWDHRDMIREINLGGGGIAYYQYDAGKQRTRKRIENQNGLGGYWERIYLGGYELYRRYNGSGANPIEEIETHHLFEGDQRVLIVDDVITASNQAQPRPDGLTVQRQTLFRYQYTNHLGSACLEADSTASVISYEELRPYGNSAYRALKGGVEAPPARYRYTGMERDDESGLNYHHTRNYAPWLGRWVTADPIGLGGGLNVYGFVSSNPVSFRDRTGKQGIPGIYDPQGLLAQGMGNLIEYFGIGGRFYSTYTGGQLSMVYHAPNGGVGGVYGGMLRTVSFRLIPSEKDPSAYGRAGAEAGASLVPILDPVEKLITGETVTGYEANRAMSALELALDVAPIVPEMSAALEGMKVNKLRREIRSEINQELVQETEALYGRLKPHLTPKEEGPVFAGAKDIDYGDMAVAVNLQPKGVKTLPPGTPRTKENMAALTPDEIARATESLEPVLRDRSRARIADLKARKDAGLISDDELWAGLAGTHAEIKAVDSVLKMRKARLGRPMTEADLDRVVTHQIWTKSGEFAQKCVNCKSILNGVPETQPASMWDRVKGFFK
jgi:RHS repeat-associated protein